MMARLHWFDMDVAVQYGDEHVLRPGAGRDREPPSQVGM